jgi:hypothetical protein
VPFTTQASSRYRNDAKLTDFIGTVNPPESALTDFGNSRATFIRKTVTTKFGDFRRCLSDCTYGSIITLIGILRQH